ncbi:hypothetical protein [Cupriavidus pinatubonensis]|uniref:Lipoprotein n=1 Tax=Cupriavidus pinatubonensis TaxID=248026 RepID=A0ABM8WLA7_9BURK|nr:hypothetical protein [Cupriavidus pinatubonensis]CAG9168161.1 hypothetical protein LMG23994_01325 [Cupriavidus pinatubonensis]
MKRANIFTVTENYKIKGVKDRRNALPLADIQARIAYDPATGDFTYRIDCTMGKAGETAIWRCRRMDCAGTPYESTRQWELVKYDENHWYDPRKLAFYFVNGEWPPTNTWVAGGRKYDYSAAGLQLMVTGKLPTPQPEPRKDFVVETNTVASTKGFFARLFGL